jgi:very-short-patch-repair endonuclease
MCAFKVSSAAGERLARHARCMRRYPTPSEASLWQAIRGRRLGVRFVRQVALGVYIVDFLAPQLKLIVEVDGGYHAARVGADGRRQRWLERRGYRVVRVSAAMVLHDVDAAVAVIVAALADRG